MSFPTTHSIMTVIQSTAVTKRFLEQNKSQFLALSNREWFDLIHVVLRKSLCEMLILADFFHEKMVALANDKDCNLLESLPEFRLGDHEAIARFVCLVNLGFFWCLQYTTEEIQDAPHESQVDLQKLNASRLGRGTSALEAEHDFYTDKHLLKKRQAYGNIYFCGRDASYAAILNEIQVDLYRNACEFGLCNVLNAMFQFEYPQRRALLKREHGIVRPTPQTGMALSSALETTSLNTGRINYLDSANRAPTGHSSSFSVDTGALAAQMAQAEHENPGSVFAAEPHLTPGDHPQQIRHPEEEKKAEESQRIYERENSLRKQKDAYMLRVRQGICPTMTDAAGNTGIHYAAVGGHLPVVKQLIELGVDPQKANNEGESPYEFAWRNTAPVPSDAVQQCLVLLRPKELKKAESSASSAPQRLFPVKSNLVVLKTLLMKQPKKLTPEDIEMFSKILKQDNSAVRDLENWINKTKVPKIKKTRQERLDNLNSRALELSDITHQPRIPILRV